MNLIQIWKIKIIKLEFNKFGIFILMIIKKYKYFCQFFNFYSI